jgi:hypothetical protein
MAIAVLLDVSGSMRGRPLEAMRQGLAEFVSRARPVDRMALATFADDIRWEASWNSSPETIRAALPRLEARGRFTRLYDAVSEAVSHFETTRDPLPVRRRIIVISDGHDEGSRISVEEAIRRARSARIDIDTIGIGSETSQYLPFLSRLSTDTAGRFREAPTLEILKQRIPEGIDALLATPVAIFDAQNFSADGKAHMAGVRWKRGDSVDVRPVTLPEGGRGRMIWWLAGAAAVTALAIIFLLTRRKSPPLPVRSSPAPAPAPAPVPVVMVASMPGSREAAPVQVLRTPTFNENPRKAKQPPAQSPIETTRETLVQTPARETLLMPSDHPRASVRILAEFGPLMGKAIDVPDGELWIGAAADNQISIPNDPYLSSKHCCLLRVGSELSLRDNRSRNKTLVNGESLAGDECRKLANGDRVKAGGSVFTVEVAS